MGGGGGGCCGLEEIGAIFRQVKPHCSNSNPKQQLTSKPFIFHVHNANAPSLLFISVTDFHTNTFQSTNSALDLEDMRQMAGIGGPWTDFVDYIRGSFTSENLKLVLEGQSKSGGAVSAKVIAQKSDGMPTVKISLTKLVDAAASEAMSKITLELFKLYKHEHELLINEQQHCYQLIKVLAAEQEKNYVIQAQLDASIASQAMVTYVCSQEKNDATLRELDSSFGSSDRSQEKNNTTKSDQDSSSDSLAFALISRQEKNDAIKRKLEDSSASRPQKVDASIASGAMVNYVFRGEKNDGTPRELNSSFGSSLTREAKNTIQSKQDASSDSWAFTPTFGQEKNDAIQRKLDASSACRPLKIRKISGLINSDAMSQNNSDNQIATTMPLLKDKNCLVPAYRRGKVEEILLIESDDEKG